MDFSVEGSYRHMWRELCGTTHDDDTTTNRCSTCCCLHGEPNTARTCTAAHTQQEECSAKLHLNPVVKLRHTTYAYTMPQRRSMRWCISYPLNKDCLLHTIGATAIQTNGAGRLWARQAEAIIASLEPAFKSPARKKVLKDVYKIMKDPRVSEEHKLEFLTKAFETPRLHNRTFWEEACREIDSTVLSREQSSTDAEKILQFISLLSSRMLTFPMDSPLMTTTGRKEKKHKKTVMEFSTGIYIYHTASTQSSALNQTSPMQHTTTTHNIGNTAQPPASVGLPIPPVNPTCQPPPVSFVLYGKCHYHHHSALPTPLGHPVATGAPTHTTHKHLQHCSGARHFQTPPPPPPLPISDRDHLHCNHYPRPDVPTSSSSPSTSDTYHNSTSTSSSRKPTTTSTTKASTSTTGTGSVLFHVPVLVVPDVVATVEQQGAGNQLAHFAWYMTRLSTHGDLQERTMVGLVMDGERAILCFSPFAGRCEEALGRLATCTMVGTGAGASHHHHHAGGTGTGSGLGAGTCDKCHALPLILSTPPFRWNHLVRVAPRQDVGVDVQHISHHHREPHSHHRTTASTSTTEASKSSEKQRECSSNSAESEESKKQRECLSNSTESEESSNSSITIKKQRECSSTGNTDSKSDGRHKHPQAPHDTCTHTHTHSRTTRRVVDRRVATFLGVLLQSHLPRVVVDGSLLDRTVVQVAHRLSVKWM